MKDYFLRIDHESTIYNLSKDKAIELGKKNYNSANAHLIGIGKYKMSGGKKVYTLVPLQFFV